jgi:hypothetical protein
VCFLLTFSYPLQVYHLCLELCQYLQNVVLFVARVSSHWVIIYPDAKLEMGRIIVPS